MRRWIEPNLAGESTGQSWQLRKQPAIDIVLAITSTAASIVCVGAPSRVSGVAPRNKALMSSVVGEIELCDVLD